MWRSSSISSLTLSCQHAVQQVDSKHLALFLLPQATDYANVHISLLLKRLNECKPQKGKTMFGGKYIYVKKSNKPGLKLRLFSNSRKILSAKNKLLV